MVTELYKDYNVDYNRINLYFKNCLEIGDWYYRELINLYEEAANLPAEKREEEFHGFHTFYEYTDESINEIASFTEQLNQLLNDKFITDNNTNT